MRKRACLVSCGNAWTCRSEREAKQPVSMATSSAFCQREFSSREGFTPLERTCLEVLGKVSGITGKSMSFCHRCECFYETLNKMARTAGRYFQVKLWSHSSGGYIVWKTAQSIANKGCVRNPVNLLAGKHVWASWNKNAYNSERSWFLKMLKNMTCKYLV